MRASYKNIEPLDVTLYRFIFLPFTYSFQKQFHIKKTLHSIQICATVLFMLAKSVKKKVIDTVQKHDEDTGSPEVQIAVLTKRIEELADHLKTHHKDKHSRRGLLKMVADRHALSRYLKKKDPKRYSAVAKKMGLKVN